MAAVQRALLWAAVLAPLVHARADVIFQVPEVQVRHAAASKPVGTGRATVNRTGSDHWAAGEETVVRYEEYMIEHEVSSVEAKRAANELNLDNVKVNYAMDRNWTTPNETAKDRVVPLTRDGCGACTHNEMQYCETRVLADHCCCERGYFPEPFPWLPHTCYIGRDRCHLAAPDCASYARLRDCCCHRKLAERYKSLLSSSTQLGVSGASLLLLSMLLLVARL